MPRIVIEWGRTDPPSRGLLTPASPQTAAVLWAAVLGGVRRDPTAWAEIRVNGQTVRAWPRTEPGGAA